MELKTLYFDGVAAIPDNSINYFICFNDRQEEFIAFHTDLNRGVLVFGNNSGASFDNRIEFKSHELLMNKKIKLIVRWNGEHYDVFYNGQKLEISLQSGEQKPIKVFKISLFYRVADNIYRAGELYDLRISSKSISENDAIEITSEKNYIFNIMKPDNTEIIYTDLKNESEKIINQGLAAPYFDLILNNLNFKELESIVFLTYLLHDNTTTTDDENEARIIPVKNKAQFVDATFKAQQLAEQNLKGNIYNHQITFNIKNNNNIYNFIKDFNLYDEFILILKGKRYLSILTSYTFKNDSNMVKLNYGKVRHKLTKKIIKLFKEE